MVVKEMLYIYIHTQLLSVFICQLLPKQSKN
jgi:hypothetical protein